MPSFNGFSGYTNLGTITYTTSSSIGGYASPVPVADPPRLKTVLDWLSDEVEATCKLARVA